MKNALVIFFRIIIRLLALVSAAIMFIPIPAHDIPITVKVIFAILGLILVSYAIGGQQLIKKLAFVDDIISRVLGLTMGSLLTFGILYFFYEGNYHVVLRSVIAFPFGIALIGYGIGGQRFLEKFFPRLSEKYRTNKD